MEWHCANFLSPYNTFHFLKQQMRQNPIQIIQEKLDKEQVPAQLVLSAERTETIKKPKPLKLQNVEEEVKKVKSLLTQAKVKRLLEYRDGELYWKVDRLRAKKGDKDGTTKGYKIVFIEGQHYTFGHATEPFHLISWKTIRIF
jgi:hypothetical protein